MQVLVAATMAVPAVFCLLRGVPLVAREIEMGTRTRGYRPVRRPGR